MTTQQKKENCGRNLSPTGRRRLLKELDMINNDSTLGITARLGCDENGNEVLDIWDLFMNGPQGIYENYTLHAKIHFPENYPFCPPTFCFVTPMFHPNIYKDGAVCISILHTDRDDPTNSAYDNCTWTPSQNVRTVCLSITSLLDSPNIYSPANVDASNLLRDHKVEYEAKVRELLDRHCRKDAAID